jgi:hypothetical protein
LAPGRRLRAVIGVWSRRRDAIRAGRDVIAGIAELAAGEAFTCRRAGGRVTCCGNGWRGELGNGASEDEGAAGAVRGRASANLVAGRCNGIDRRCAGTSG